jgi:hypothetical protein
LIVEPAFTLEDPEIQEGHTIARISAASSCIKEQSTKLVAFANISKRPSITLRIMALATREETSGPSVANVACNILT